jgi:hypothetical protein
MSIVGGTVRGLVNYGCSTQHAKGSTVCPNTKRTSEIRCTSVLRRDLGAVPIRLVVHVPQAGCGERAGSQARWRKRG